MKSLNANQVVPGLLIPYGHTSSPSLVFITKVEGDTVFFKESPIYSNSRERRESITYFLLAANRGIINNLQALGRYAARVTEASNPYVFDRIDFLNKLLTGQPVPLQTEDEEYSYAVWVKPTDELKVRLREELKTDDAWAYLDSLTGGCCNAYNEDEGTYEITVFGTTALNEIRENKLLVVTNTKHNECYVGCQ